MVEQFFSLDEVSTMLKVQERTVRSLLDSGQLKGLKIGREWRVTATAIDEFARAGESGASYENEVGEMQVGKYQPLHEYLRDSGKERLPLAFAEVEKILGFSLPDSARKYDAWWHQERNPRGQKVSWTEAGYVVESYDVPGETVTFAKSVKPERPASSALESDFYESMMHIYETAGKDHGYWASRFLQSLRRNGGVEAARRLINKLGGTGGFSRLYELKRLDLTVEALVLTPKYYSLFTDEERELCRERLRRSGFEIAELAEKEENPQSLL